jgi:competence protein ComEC
LSIRTAWRLLLIFALLNLLIVGWVWAHRYAPPGELRVTFLDVGQGDSCVVESPSGKVMVVDTGNLVGEGDDEGRKVVAPYLQSRGINHIDLLLLTHPHADHIGGAATLLERFPVGMLLENGVDSGNPLMTRILTTAALRHVVHKIGRLGQALDFGDGVTGRVLAPNEEETHGSTNDGSIVLRLQYGKTAFLLTGDAEAHEEADMTEREPMLACDVLKVGHHGSQTSSNPEFVAAAHPGVAVVSVAARNSFGLPSSSVLDRLRESGAKVYRTDRNGAVLCRSNGITVQVEPMLR